jgi:hypothetical protein
MLLVQKQSSCNAEVRHTRAATAQDSNQMGRVVLRLFWQAWELRSAL